MFKSRLDNFGESISEDNLIKFDFKSVVFLAVVCLFFALSVLFKLSGSSVAQWNYFLKSGSLKEGIVVGSSKGIRSDEWAIGTIAAMSQTSLGLPIENKNLGANADTLLTNLPVKHVTTLFRPQFWGYFVFSFDRAFSFYWCFKVFALLIGGFLLFMILTRSNFWLSATGAVWVYSSSFIQWWFSSTMSDATMMFCFMFVFLVYFLLSKKTWVVVTAGLLFLGSTINFILIFYPPLQVPVGFLLLFLTVGYLLRLPKSNYKLFLSKIGVRALVFFSLLVAFIGLMGKFYLDAKNTITAISNTVYPGKRVYLGGGLPLYRLFSGFYSNFFGQTMIGAGSTWGNICEASTFVLMYPVFLILVAFKWIQKKQIDPVIIALTAFLIIISAWVLVPFPAWFGAITLLGHTTANRTLLAIGLASIILSIVVLSDVSMNCVKISKLQQAIIITAFSLFILWIGYQTNHDLPAFEAREYVPIIILYFAALTWLALQKKAHVFIAFLLVGVAGTSFFVNPVVSGMAPINDKDIARYMQSLDRNQKDGKWLVYGDYPYSNYLKGFGLDVFNGAKYTPDLKAFSLLDPTGVNSYIYNRYAIINFYPNAENQQAVDFKMIQGDSYGVTVSPCNPKLKQLGIKHIAVYGDTYKYDQFCLLPVTQTPLNGFMIYELK